MFNIKRICAVLMAFALVFSLASCSVENSGVHDESSSVTETTSNTVRITFPEGYTVPDMAKKLEENGVCSADEFMTAANDASYLEGYDIEIAEPSDRGFLLEGYLFPDTYDFYYGEMISSVMKKFLSNYENRITDDMRARADELGYSFDEILTLASMVQVESGGSTSECRKISSVIHNRLDSPDYSRLQCDCCSFYLRDDLKPYVSEERYEELLETYSTYNCTGLPEGPICNPGLDAINAALYPDDTDYYFFVTDDDGVYYYAETWSEHQENCSRAGIE